MKTLSLRQAWIALIGGVLLLGLVPAGIALDRRLAAELEEEARSDLAMAPKILADRNQGRGDALMMRAKETAGVPGLAEAVAEDRRADAVRLARDATAPGEEEPVVVGPGGTSWVGPTVPADAITATRDGHIPVVFGNEEGRLYRLSLAPLRSGSRWVGAVGVLVPLGQGTAGELAGLTQSDVVLLGPGGVPVASSGAVELPPFLGDSAAAWSGDGAVHGIGGDVESRYWAAVAPLGSAGQAVFLRDVERELGLLPDLRRSGLLAVAIALGLALLLGSLLGARMVRPVQALAVASQRLAAGDFGAPVPRSRLREVDQVSRAFREMRDRLEEKLAELTEANRELEDRQARLQALQSELIQRDRLSATGRIVTELAHEIRNPVASVRNCLEILHRRLDDDSELREFSGMAIEELLRMHRLSEQMLDAHRPLDPDADACCPTDVAEQVAELAEVAGDGEAASVSVEGPDGLEVAMSPDSLKQVLLNLVENAREALAEEPTGSGGRIEIRVSGGREREDGLVRVEVLDDGPGLEEGVRARVFDPFFTTKDEVHGVGLGLFVAQGLVRRHGGDIRASNRVDGGARFVLRLPAAEPDDAPAAAAGDGASNEAEGAATSAPEDAEAENAAVPDGREGTP